jgi:glycosyltransferase involved in cell wall biosynthesis
MGNQSRDVILWVHQFGVRDSLFLQARIIAAVLRKNGVGVQLIASQNSSLTTKLAALRRARHIYFFYGTFDLWGFAANFLGGSLVFHNITPPEFFWSTSLPLALRSRAGSLLLKAFRKKRRFIAISPFNAKVLQSTTGVVSEYCPNIVDNQSGEAKPFVERRRTDGAPFELLFVGRVVENKNLIELLVCCEKIAQTLGEPVQLTLIGDGNLSRDYYKRFQAAALGSVNSQENGFTLNWIKEPVSDYALHERYADSDLFVSTSTHEGFGLPLVESVLNGVPCLFFSNGGTESILGFDGMVPASSQHLFVARACELLLDLETKKALFQQQQIAAMRFATEQMEHQILHTYGPAVDHV